MRHITLPLFIVLLLVPLHAQLQQRDKSIILSIEEVGKPLESQYKPGVYGSGLWFRGDTLFSAHFFGASCAIAYSVDNAASWKMMTLRQPDLNISSSAHSLNGQYIVIGYEDGTLEYSNDGGRTFDPIDSPTTIRISTLAVSDSGEVMLGRDKGRVFVSRDKGATWQADTLPLVNPGHTAGVIGHIVYDQYGGVTVTYNELSPKNDVTNKVTHRGADKTWKAWEVPNARQSFRPGASRIYVNTVKRLPGRNDQAAFCQLYSIDLQTGIVAEEFTEDTTISMSTVLTVCQPKNSSTTWAVSYPHSYVLQESVWYRDPRSFKDMGLGFGSVVFQSDNIAYGVSMRCIVRVRLASPVSVEEASTGRTNMISTSNPITVDPNCTVFDLLGHACISNTGDTPLVWQAPSSGMYALSENTSKRILRWCVVE